MLFLSFALLNQATVSLLKHMSFWTRMSISEFQISRSGITESKDTHCLSDSDFFFKLEIHTPSSHSQMLGRG